MQGGPAVALDRKTTKTQRQITPARAAGGAGS